VLEDVAQPPVQRCTLGGDEVEGFQQLLPGLQAGDPGVQGALPPSLRT
jgi:hypothetical protein